MLNPADLQHGDILLYERGSSNGSLIGRIIRLVCGSKYTHCTFVMRDQDGILKIVEQDGEVTITPVAKYVFKNPKRISVWRNPDLTWNPVIPSLVAWRAVGTPYAYANIAEILFQHGMGRLVPRWVNIPLFINPLRQVYTCSSIVALLLLRSVGENYPWFVRYPVLVEPDDFSGHGFKQVM